MPDAKHSSTAGDSGPMTDSSSHGSTLTPITAAASRARRASGDSRAPRASTASRIVGGTDCSDASRAAAT